MTATQIKKELKSTYKAELLSEKQIKEFTGFGRDRTKALLAGLSHWGQRSGKRYAAIDVAERIAQSVSRY